MVKIFQAAWSSILTKRRSGLIKTKGRLLMMLRPSRASSSHSPYPKSWVKVTRVSQRHHHMMWSSTTINQSKVKESSTFLTTSIWAAQECLLLKSMALSLLEPPRKPRPPLFAFLQVSPLLSSRMSLERSESTRFKTKIKSQLLESLKSHKPVSHSSLRSLLIGVCGTAQVSIKLFSLQICIFRFFWQPRPF